MRRFVATIDADTFGYGSVTVETDRVGVSESGALLFYTDQGGINRVAYAIADGLWYACNEIDQEGNPRLALSFNEPAEEESAEDAEEESPE